MVNGARQVSITAWQELAQPVRAGASSLEFSQTHSMMCTAIVVAVFIFSGAPKAVIVLKTMFSASSELQQLADALRPVIGRGEGAKVSLELADYAIRRHRVGPLLNHAISIGASEADAAAKDSLSRSAMLNTRNTLRQKAAARKLASVLGESDIRILEFKGYHLGSLLYGAEYLRQSKDVDVLIDPASCDQAIQLLSSAGYRQPDGKPFDCNRARLVLRFAKEFEVWDPEFKVLVEIHSRLMTVQPEGWNDERFFDARLDLQNPHYVLYLLLHGGASRWHRLKWLVDLVKISTLICEEARDQTIELANKYRCLPVIVASMQICETLWGKGATGEWFGAAELTADRSHVDRHVASFEKASHRMTGNLLRESLLRRWEIRRAVPLFGNKGPSRFEVLKDRIGYWYVQRIM